MKPLGDALYHLRLLGRMGRACDVDMAEAFARGMIANREWAGMINRCRGCSNVCDCETYLTHESQMQSPPQFCQNADALASLKTRLT